MVSQEAVEAIKRELRDAKRSGKLARDRRWRRERRRELAHLLNPRRLTETRNGTTLAGLREVLQNPGGPSDASRVIGRVLAPAAKVKIWCEQLLDVSAEPGERLSVTQDSRSIPHLGRNAFSVLLHHKEPGKFGYVNGQVEQALKKLGEWPRRFPRGLGQGDKYLRINAILDDLADRVGLNSLKEERLAALDQLLWYYWERGTKVVSARAAGTLRPGDPDKDAEDWALEGGKAQVGPHLKTERNSRAATQFKILRAQKYPELECEVCGFGFQSVYGEELGKGFIEAHHRELLSARRRRRRPKEDDFDFVCSNCHRMLHRMELSEMDKVKLRKIVKSRRQAARSAVERWWSKPAPAHR
jgi:hypothetical protein